MCDIFPSYNERQQGLNNECGRRNGMKPEYKNLKLNTNAAREFVRLRTSYWLGQGYMLVDALTKAYDEVLPHVS